MAAARDRQEVGELQRPKTKERNKKNRGGSGLDENNRVAVLAGSEQVSQNRRGGEASVVGRGVGGVRGSVRLVDPLGADQRRLMNTA